MDDEYRPNRGMGVKRKKELEKDSSEKPRLKWTPDLHQKFESAFIALEHEKNDEPAFRHTGRAKNILALMDVPDVTVLQVSSHLQKYLDKRKKSAAKNIVLPRPQEVISTEPAAVRPQRLPEVLNRRPGELTCCSRDLADRTQQPHDSGTGNRGFNVRVCDRRPRRNLTYMPTQVSDDPIIRASSPLLSTALPIVHHLDANLVRSGGHRQYYQAGDELEEIQYHGGKSREIEYYKEDELDEFIAAVLSSPQRDADLNGLNGGHQGVPNMLLPRQPHMLPTPPAPAHLYRNANNCNSDREGLSPSFSASPYGQIGARYHQGLNAPTGPTGKCYGRTNAIAENSSRPKSDQVTSR